MTWIRAADDTMWGDLFALLPGCAALPAIARQYRVAVWTCARGGEFVWPRSPSRSMRRASAFRVRTILIRGCA